MNMDYRDTVCNIIKENGYRRIAEIGVWRGYLSRYIIEKCNPEHLLLVDPFSVKMNKSGSYQCLMGEQVKTQKELDVMASEISRLNADFRRLPSLEASAVIPDGSLDLVFIDAIHTYKSVTRDIRAWLPKVRKGGMISGDDFTGAHGAVVSRAVNDVLGKVINIERVWFKKVE